MGKTDGDLFTFMELKSFFFYFAITKTLNLSNDTWILVYTNKYPPRKNIKRFMRQVHPALKYWRKSCGNSSNF